MVPRSPRSPALCWRIDPLSSCTTETGVFAERPAGRSSSHRYIRWTGYHLGFRRQNARARSSGRVRGVERDGEAVVRETPVAGWERKEE
jgi:hypothetical protein